MSSRDLTSAMATAIADGTIRPVFFYEGEFYSSGSPSIEYLRLWSGLGSYTWDGKVWAGGGKLLSISPLEETRDVKAIGFSISMSGLATADLSRALQNVRQNKPGRLWLGLFDGNGDLIADPYQMREGRMDTVGIDRDGATCTITAQYEDRMIILDQAPDFLYTHEDQQLFYAGDLGFEYVAALQDMTLLWGGPGAAASPVATPSVPDTGAPGSSVQVGHEWATYNDAGQLSSLVDLNQETGRSSWHTPSDGD